MVEPVSSEGAIIQKDLTPWQRGRHGEGIGLMKAVQGVVVLWGWAWNLGTTVKTKALLARLRLLLRCRRTRCLFSGE